MLTENGKKVLTIAEYIEREATIELLRSLGSRDYRREKGTIQEAIKMVSFPEYTPSADVAPVRHGRWEEMHYEGGILDGTNFDRCSICGYERVLDDPALKTVFKYCPNCGAMMDGGAD